MLGEMAGGDLVYEPPSRSFRPKAKQRLEDLVQVKQPWGDRPSQFGARNLHVRLGRKMTVCL